MGVEVRDLCLWAVATVCRSWGQPDPGGAGEGGSSPDKAEVRQHCQMAWAPRAGSKGVREELML